MALIHIYCNKDFNSDFKVRYYCGNNVVDWYADLFITHEVPYSNSYFSKDIDQTKSLIHQPALYDSQGLKLAECATSFELNGVTKQIQVIYFDEILIVIFDGDFLTRE